MSVYLENSSPRSMAERLASYIKDPSTIRVRVLEYYGRAPTLHECKLILQAKNQRIEAAEKAELARIFYEKPFSCGHPKSEENTAFRDNGKRVCLICRRKLEAEAAKRYREKRKARQGQKKVLHHLALPEWYQPPTDKRPRTVSDTLQAVADAFKISRDDLVGAGRYSTLVDARAVAAMVFRNSGGMSYPQIKRILNRKCHSTIMNLCETWPVRVKRNPYLADIYMQLVAGGGE